MTQEEKQARLKRLRSKEAIDLAMKGQWREAIDANKTIVEAFPNDVDSYNRMGKAYMELGEYEQAREAYRHAIEFDPYNTIARKNLQRLSYINEGSVSVGNEVRKVEPQQFIEEIGKAGVVHLVRLAPWEVRAKAVAGDKVNLKINGPNLVVEALPGEYLGQVEVRHGPRLIKLMAGGNQYSAAVVSSTEQGMTVIIRETRQDPSQVGRLSFPPKGVEERPPVEERLLKMEAEFEEEASEESGYTIIGGEEIEVVPEETAENEEELSKDDE